MSAGPAHDAPGVGLGAPGAAVEVATWRPLAVVDVEGWQVGLSGGFTRRANSAVPWAEPAEPDAAVDRVEQIYRAHGLAPRFRVCGATRPACLDARLEARGYRRVAATDVMVRALPVAASGGSVTRPVAGAMVTVADAPDADWLAGWLGVKATAPVDDATARAVVTGSPARYLTARDDDGVVGVVRGALAGDWVGLSSLMVAPRARRRGLATALTLAALAAAVDAGARRAFLQVEAENGGARALYGGLGFARAESYHYREL